MKPTKTKDPLAILSALNAAIAPPPQVLPDGWMTVKQWAVAWQVGDCAASRKLKAAHECGHFGRVKVRTPIGAGCYAYGPALAMLFAALSAFAGPAEDIAARLGTNTVTPMISATNSEPPMVTPLPRDAALVASRQLPAVDKSAGVTVRWSARPGAIYYVQARAATSAKWRAVSPHLPSVAPRMGWQVDGTNVVKYYQVQEGWRVGSNFTFAPAGVATNR